MDATDEVQIPPPPENEEFVGFGEAPAQANGVGVEEELFMPQGAGAEEGQQASDFLDGFVEPAADAAPVAPEEPAEEDPRVAWRRRNQQLLREKDEAEAKQREEQRASGAAHMKRINEAREKALSARKAQNRQAASTHKPETGAAMDGTTWQKVNQLAIGAGTAGKHTKDITRFKQSLLHLKSEA